MRINNRINYSETENGMRYPGSRYLYDEDNPNGKHLTKAEKIKLANGTLRLYEWVTDENGKRVKKYYSAMPLGYVVDRDESYATNPVTKLMSKPSADNNPTTDYMGEVLPEVWATPNGGIVPHQMPEQPYLENLVRREIEKKQGDEMANYIGDGLTNFFTFQYLFPDLFLGALINPDNEDRPFTERWLAGNYGPLNSWWGEHFPIISEGVNFVLDSGLPFKGVKSTLNSGRSLFNKGKNILNNYRKINTYNNIHPLIKLDFSLFPQSTYRSAGTKLFSSTSSADLKLLSEKLIDEYIKNIESNTYRNRIAAVNKFILKAHRRGKHKHLLYIDYDKFVEEVKRLKSLIEINSVDRDLSSYRTTKNVKGVGRVHGLTTALYALNDLSKIIIDMDRNAYTNLLDFLSDVWHEISHAFTGVFDPNSSELVFKNFAALYPEIAKSMIFNKHILPKPTDYGKYALRTEIENSSIAKGKTDEEIEDMYLKELDYLTHSLEMRSRAKLERFSAKRDLMDEFLFDKDAYEKYLKYCLSAIPIATALGSTSNTNQEDTYKHGGKLIKRR